MSDELRGLLCLLSASALLASIAIPGTSMGLRHALVFSLSGRQLITTLGVILFALGISSYSLAEAAPTIVAVRPGMVALGALAGLIGSVVTHGNMSRE
jgi:hypothetical protein